MNPRKLMVSAAERVRAAALNASVHGALLGRRQGRYHVLFAAPGGGNIGDQAMADVFCEQVVGDVRVLLVKPDAVIVPQYGEGSRRGVVIEGLMSRNPLTFVAAFARLARLLRGASSLSVTGADIMDGGYNSFASLFRWRLALAAQRGGLQTRILGFSWNGRASRPVSHAAARAARAGVRLYVRDPLSRARMAKASIGPTYEASDTVFALGQQDRDTDVYRLLSQAREGGERIALVNASALVSKRVDQPREYQVVLNALRDSGYLPVLLPHVHRGPGGDMKAVQDVVAATPDAPWYVVEELLRPAQIRALLSLTDVVVTGRMHLGIMALSMGKPAFIISTQGKVEGLGELFECPEIAVAADSGLGNVIAERIADSPLLHSMGHRIAERLPLASSLSMQNFEGLIGRRSERAPVGDPDHINETSRVSVIVPTHRRASFLPASIGSVLAQSRPPVEIIVCSDVADEDTEKAVADLAATTDVPIHYVHDPETVGGASASRNGGAKVAQGDVLAFLDDDDSWEPGYLLAAIQAGSAARTDMAVVARWMVKGDTRVEAPTLEPNKSAQDVVAVSLGTTGSNMVLTRRAFDRSGGFDESIPVKNDTDFFFRFLLAGHTYVSVSDRLALQVKHGTGQLTGNTERRAAGTKTYMAKHSVHLRARDRRHLRLSYFRIRYHLAKNPLTKYMYLAMALINYSPKKYLEERSVRRAWIELEGAGK